MIFDFHVVVMAAIFFKKSENTKVKISDNKNKGNKDKSNSPKRKISIEDFEISYILGKGSYAKVVLAKNISSLKDYALKIIDKKFLKRVIKYKAY